MTPKLDRQDGNGIDGGWLVSEGKAPKENKSKWHNAPGANSGGAVRCDDFKRLIVSVAQFATEGKHCSSRSGCQSLCIT